MEETIRYKFYLQIITYSATGSLYKPTQPIEGTRYIMSENMIHFYDGVHAVAVYPANRTIIQKIIVI